MLDKNPDSRITLDQIKDHQWLCQSEYAALASAQLGEEISGDVAIDSETVHQMTELGIDCHFLEEQFASGTFSELTATYRELLKNRATDDRKDALLMLDGLPRRKEKEAKVAKPGPATLAMPRRTSCLTPRPMMPRLSAPIKPPPPVLKGGIPAIPSCGAANILQAPPTVHIQARRLSRPVAVRKMDLPGAKGAAALESP
jgi:hypothetical protein